MGRYDGDSGLFTMAEFKNRGVIKLAPDALVFISGNFGTAVVAPVSGATQKVDFQDGITSINVQNNVDPPGSSSASIEITTPIYNDKSNYWISYKGENGQTIRTPYFVPMMEVKVFFKGRFMVGQEPKFYPVFWGFITNVDESYSGGTFKITLQCADMLHWWQYINVAFHPSVESDVSTGNKQGLSVWKSRYEQANSFEIIYSLAVNAGFGNFTVPSWLGKTTPTYDILSANEIKDVWLDGIMKYWNKRFNNQVNLLKMYGAKGTLVQQQSNGRLIPSTSPSDHPDTKTINSNKGAQSTDSLVQAGFDVDQAVSSFSVYGMYSDMGNLDSAEYMTKLDVATQVKQMVEYEFFQDVNGNFIFKPPFYNLNTKNMMPYRIKPQDIITYSSAVNSEEILTALEIQISPNAHFQQDDWINKVGYHVDMDLTKRYGERYRKIPLWYLSGDANIAWALAAGHLSLINVKAFVGSVQIPGRPELRMGYPVYIEHQDLYYYVTSINHSFDYGGSFTTTLSMNGLRPRTFGKDGSGRTVIQKNKIYKLTDKFIVGSDEVLDSNKTYDQIKAGELTDPNKKMELLNRNNNVIKSTELGKYKIVTPDESDPLDRTTIQSDSVPYTDDEGYKVIGSFKYGRGIVLAPGVPLDEATVQGANETKADFEKKKMAIAVTGIKTAADEEGSSMQDYFSTTLHADIEAAIPIYLKEITASKDPYSINNSLTNAVTTGAGEPMVDILQKVNETDPLNIDRPITAGIDSVPNSPGTPGTPATDSTLTRINLLWSDEIDKASEKYGVSKDLIIAVMAQESRGIKDALSHIVDTDKNSPTYGKTIDGARGLMQLMPLTAGDLGLPLSDIYDPQKNIDAGTKYLKQMSNKYNGDVTLTLAAYNSGPGNVDYYGGVPPVSASPRFQETHDYIANITATLNKLKGTSTPTAPASLTPVPKKSSGSTGSW